ncbi:hypothetical protein EPA93_16130 [Ktedonosporobacter rubrisoli]|uniref:Uncharacterized protein n=1 Tax=Ktedonosporobacter rubrisoli TaxID=2509675 RepID=A0A4P6JPW4_KTERU|nr:hypothetical protein [Ktedonosporobacter rubrisoli]QBD77437.1 hypothetical protein EPA93_16130 [Ktedonosporobacter rubrisoli]
MFGRRFARAFFGGGPWGPPPWWYGPGGGQWEQGRGWFAPEQQALRSTAAEVARLFMIASRSAAGNPERQAQLRDFLERSRKDLTDMIYGAGKSSGTGEA